MPQIIIFFLAFVGLMKALLDLLPTVPPDDLSEHDDEEDEE